MAMGMVAGPALRGVRVSRDPVEIVAPGRVPAEWEQWKAERRQAFEEHRDPGTVSEGGPNPARQAAIGHPFTRGARGAGADEALADRVHPQGGACRAR